VFDRTARRQITIDLGASWAIDLQEFAMQVTAAMLALARIDAVDDRFPGGTLLAYS
jgi:hypothetical protein